MTLESQSIHQQDDMEKDRQLLAKIALANEILQEQLAILSHREATLTAENSALETRRIEESQAHEAELQELSRSLSWRLTYPFRTLSHLFSHRRKNDIQRG